MMWTSSRTTKIFQFPLAFCVILQQFSIRVHGRAGPLETSSKKSSFWRFLRPGRIGGKTHQGIIANEPIRNPLTSNINEPLTPSPHEYERVFDVTQIEVGGNIEGVRKGDYIAPDTLWKLSNTLTNGDNVDVPLVFEGDVCQGKRRTSWLKRRSGNEDNGGKVSGKIIVGKYNNGGRSVNDIQPGDYLHAVHIAPGKPIELTGDMFRLVQILDILNPSIKAMKENKEAGKLPNKDTSVTFVFRRN